jgi:hypothetical protein
MPRISPASVLTRRPTGELDAAALAAAARVDLGLDDPDRAAELLRRLDGLPAPVNAGMPARHGHAEVAQDLPALVLVNLHEVSLREWNPGMRSRLR